MFLIDYAFTASTNKLAELRPHHIEHLKPHYDRGSLLIGGRKTDGIGGIIIAHACDRSAIEELVASDPFVTGGAADVSITAFDPVMWDPKLSSLVQE